MLGPLVLGERRAGFVFGLKGMPLLYRRGVPGKNRRRCPSKDNLKLAKIVLWRFFFPWDCEGEIGRQQFMAPLFPLF